MPKDLVINNGKLDTTKLVGAPNVRQINYILNADAEVDTTGWATYADAAQATPVDGTGGTPQASLWIRSTTTPIRGVGSFRLDKTGSATRQGQGASYAFTIDKGDQAKVLSISFDYEVVSGTYATGDLTVYVYDVTNAQVIQPAGFSIEALGSGVQNKLIATFQTASNSTSYRLILHVASASTQNYTLAFDNVTVGPQTVQYGAPITDWVSYTPTFTNMGTPTNVAFRSRRVGSDLEIQGAFTTGTGAAAEARVSLGYNGSNSNVNIDTSRITTNAVVGTVGFSSSSTGFAAAYVVASGANAYLNFSAQQDTTNNLTVVNGNAFASGNSFRFFVKIPISGFGSSVVMSDTTDTRVVIAQFGSSTANLVVSGSAGVNIIWPSVNFDTHGSYNTSTGIYTVPVPGYYKVSISEVYTPTAGSHYLNLHKNGNYLQNVVMYAQISGTVETGSTVAFFNAGDQVSIRSSSNHTIEYGASAYRSKVTIERISGPSSIAATESVSVIGTGTISNSSYTANTAIRFTSTKDSHSAYSNATGKFTAPVSGIYLATVYQDVVTGLSAGNNIRLNVNDVASVILGNNSLNNYPISGSGVVQLLAGQTLHFTISSNTTLSSSNFYSITRLGNY